MQCKSLKKSFLGVLTFNFQKIEQRKQYLKFEFNVSL